MAGDQTEALSASHLTDLKDDTALMDVTQPVRFCVLRLAKRALWKRN